MPIEELVAYFSHDTAPSSDVSHQLHLENRLASGLYRGMTLQSVFQPLFDSRTLRAGAHEALLRVRDARGRPLSPAEAFAVPVTAEDAVRFDRLCRIVHALNFVAQADAKAELYLNLSGRHLLGLASGNYGETFEKLLAMCGLRPERIVIEVLESSVDNIGHLNEAVEAYRKRGYRVAIDDFGCENSNFDRLWRLTPDLVKLDRSLILQGTTNLRARRILPKLVDIIHDLGAKVVCEGIETLEQHQLAIDAGADLVQGYYYAMPARELVSHAAHRPEEKARQA